MAPAEGGPTLATEGTEAKSWLSASNVGRGGGRGVPPLLRRCTAVLLHHCPSSLMTPASAFPRTGGHRLPLRCTCPPPATHRTPPRGIWSRTLCSGSHPSTSTPPIRRGAMRLWVRLTTARLRCTSARASALSGPWAAPVHSLRPQSGPWPPRPVHHNKTHIPRPQAHL